jgi:DNA-binding transcriptional ArsR family regulator
MEQPDFGRDVERFLDRVLLAAHDQKSNKQARLDLHALMKVHGEIRSRHQASIDHRSYRLGATVVLQKLFIRIIERKEGNRVLLLVRRRKHVADLLQILARASVPVMPSVLAERLGIQQPAVTTLLKATDGAGLTKEATGEDGRYRPRIITPTGKTILNAFRPTWALDASRESGVQMTQEGVVVVTQVGAKSLVDAETTNAVNRFRLVEANEQVQVFGLSITPDRNSKDVGYTEGTPRSWRAAFLEEMQKPKAQAVVRAGVMAKAANETSRQSVSMAFHSWREKTYPGNNKASGIKRGGIAKNSDCAVATP